MKEEREEGRKEVMLKSGGGSLIRHAASLNQMLQIRAAHGLK